MPIIDKIVQSISSKKIKNNRSIDLSNSQLDQLTNEEWQQLSDTLAAAVRKGSSYFSAITVNLSGNKLSLLSPDSLLIFGEFLAKLLPPKIILNLTNNRLDALNAEQSNAFSTALSKCKNLTELRLDWSMLTVIARDDISPFAHMLTQTQNITLLFFYDLRQPNLTPNEWDNIAARCKTHHLKIAISYAFLGGADAFGALASFKIDDEYPINAAYNRLILKKLNVYNQLATQNHPPLSPEVLAEEIACYNEILELGNVSLQYDDDSQNLEATLPLLDFLKQQLTVLAPQVLISQNPPSLCLENLREKVSNCLNMMLSFVQRK